MVINYMYSLLTFLIEFTDAGYLASVNSSTIIQQYADWTREIIAANAIEEYEMHEGLYCSKYSRFLLHLPIQHLDIPEHDLFTPFSLTRLFLDSEPDIVVE